MAVEYRIFPDRGLVYVRYSGQLLLDETWTAFAQYAADPEFRPGQKQLVDLSQVEGVEQDFPKLMQLQARKAGVIGRPDVETLMVFLAPGKSRDTIAQYIRRSWEGLERIVVRIVPDEAEALSCLGQQETNLSTLLAVAR